MSMNGTILLDLDGTLLVNPSDHFLTGYLKLLQTFFATYERADQLIPVLMQGTQKMVQNTSPAKTLRQVFDEYFYPTLGVEKEEMLADLEIFYSREFPKLQSITSPRTGAKELVNLLISHNYSIAVATNPLFPLPAIEHRLAWAGLPVETTPYQLVTSYETFHFSKPQPAFFAEMLARLGWSDGPVVMIGDDLDLDIIPANKLGLPTFWTSVEAKDSDRDGLKNINPGIPSRSGTFHDAWKWLEQSTSSSSLVPRFESPTAYTAILRSTPAALDFFIDQIEPGNWYKRSQKGEWAPVEILCHLRDVDHDVNLPRVKRMLAEKNPHLTGVDSDIWAEERHYLQQNYRDAFATFRETRLELLEFIDQLSDEEWQKTARHSILGKTDLAEIIRIISEHDRLHIRQIKRPIQQ